MVFFLSFLLLYANIHLKWFVMYTFLLTFLIRFFFFLLTIPFFFYKLIITLKWYNEYYSWCIDKDHSDYPVVGSESFISVNEENIV